MKPEIILTGDGSHSLRRPDLNLTYHSRYGAIAESGHVYMDAGLRPLLRAGKVLQILDMGFGTGLNALLTRIRAEKESCPIHYCGLEPFPLDKEVTEELNYCQVLGRPDLEDFFRGLHAAPWGQRTLMHPCFDILKIKENLESFQGTCPFDLIYFDAFDPGAEPALWREENFRKLFHCLEPGGILVTYSASGKVRRALRSAGFCVERLPGAPPKREMLRGTKPAEKG